MRLALLLLVFCVAACPSNTGSLTGLPRDEQWNQVSQADLVSACERSGGGQPMVSDALIRGECIGDAQDGESVADCNASLDGCITLFKQHLSPPPTAADCATSKRYDLANLASCTATVGETEDCIAAINDSIAARYDGVTCESPKPNDVPDASESAACIALKSKCPQFLGDDMVTSDN